jgi:AcrR family transcriptional regulator
MAAPADNGNARDAILAGFERLLERQPLDEIRVAHILEESNTSRASFYFYFSSRDDAFAALLDAVADEIVPQFAALVAARDPDDPAAFRAALVGRLEGDGGRSRIVRSAAAAWPSSNEIRDAYFRSVDRHAEILAQAIDEDRAAGVAIEGVASQQLAAGLIWTIERVWYGAVTGFDDLGEPAQVADALASTVTAAIYGR